MSAICELLTGGKSPHSYFDKFQASPFKWNQKKVWLHFEETPEFDKQDMTKSELDIIIRRCERQWEGNIGLIFAHTRYQDKADINYKFSDVPPATYQLPSWEEQTIALGHYPFSETNKIAGDIWFNSIHYSFADYYDYIKKEKSFTGKTDFGSVAIHEMGHTIGLGHSQYPTAVMAAYYRLNFPLVLKQDDIDGGNFLYGLNDFWPEDLKIRLGF